MGLAEVAEVAVMGEKAALTEGARLAELRRRNVAAEQ